VWRAVYDDAPVLALHDDTNPACPVGRSIVSTLGAVRTRVSDATEAELDRRERAQCASLTPAVRALLISARPVASMVTPTTRLLI
jgi:hypothetical protein